MNIDLHIEEDISIWVNDVVALALCVVRQHVDCPGIKDRVELLDSLL